MEDTNNETLSIEGLRESFGLPATDQQPNSAPATEPPTTEGTENNAESENAAAQKTENEGGEQTPVTEESSNNKDQSAQQTPAEELPLEKLNREAHTFAAMRKQISEQNKVLADLGKALGIEGKPEEVLEGLKKITNAKQAKDAGVPPEVMQRITALEQEKAERAANDRKIQVYASINKFQRDQNLSKPDLDKFLVRLAQAGKNPFEQDIDLRSEYLVMYFDELQAKAVQEALEKQAALDQKAATQGTNPGKTIGGGVPQKSEVNTLDGLEAFLKANVK